MAANGSSECVNFDEKVAVSSSEMKDISVKNKGFEIIGVVCAKNGVFNGTLVYGNSAINRLNLNKVGNPTNANNSTDNHVVANRPRNGRNTINTNNNNLNNADLISGRTLRYDRAGSTDSVAVSSGGSDHGGSDTCQSSSSETTSVSEPCSPEAGPESTSRPGTPQPMPPIPPSLAEDNDHHHRHRNHGHHRLMDLEEQRVPDHRVVTTSAIFRSLSNSETDKSRSLEPQPEPVAVWCANSANASEKTPVIPVIVAEEPSITAVERFVTEIASIAVAEAELKNERLREDCVVSVTTIANISSTKDSKKRVVGGVKRKLVVDSKGIKVEPTEDFDETSCASVVPAIARHVEPVDDRVCKWHGCKNDVPTDRLVEHMKSCHVDCQMENETFICQWVGCKVYNRPSCSVSWLQRHILSHGGNKPFKCIVEGCQHRFASQSALERHVNSHFNSTQSNSSSLGGAGSSCAGKAGKSKEDTPTKLFKKRKLRYRRRCWAVKTEDYFDAGVMEHVRHNLVEMERKCSLDTLGASRIVNFHSNVIARRIEESGKVKLLLHWTPEDVFPDSWISECQLDQNLNRSIPLSLLPRDTLCKLDPSLKSISSAKRRRK